MDTAIIQTIEHWDRMITWVEAQNLQNSVDRLKMQCAIREHWGGSYCPLCIKYGEDCGNCPLYRAQGRIPCGAKSALWRKLDTSCTWAEWLSFAKPLFILLKSLEEKGEEEMRPIKEGDVVEIV